jgi:AcrR family transcriptional regulator
MDRRVRRTRQALQGALVALMAEKGYEAVTVQHVIDRADVGRSTFYAHYDDKADLLQDSLENVRAMLRPAPVVAPPDRRRPLTFSLPMLRHVSDQQALLRALLVRPGTDPVMAGIRELLTEAVTAELGALAAVSGPPRVPPALVTATVVAAFEAALTWWVETDFEATPEQVERGFQVMAAAAVRAALPTAAG